MASPTHAQGYGKYTRIRRHNSANTLCLGCGNLNLQALITLLLEALGAVMNNIALRIPVRLLAHPRAVLLLVEHWVQAREHGRIALA